MTTQPKQNNVIRAAALACVAVTSGFIMFMSWRLIDILAAPDWCARAINAEKLATSRATSSVELCKELLFRQVGSLATNSHIYAGTIALCLLVLVVIVIAGGRLNFKATKDGIDANMSRQDPAVQGAEHVEQAAHEAVEEVKAGQ